MMFIVRHDAYHDALWTAWLDSVNGLLPAAAVQEACCGRGRGGWLQRRRRLRSRRRSALVRHELKAPWLGAIAGPSTIYACLKRAVVQARTSATHASPRLRP